MLAIKIVKDGGIIILIGGISNEKYSNKKSTSSSGGI